MQSALSLDDDTKRRAVRQAWLKQPLPEVPFMVEVGQPHFATQHVLDHPENDLAWQVEHCHELASLEDYSVPNLKPHVGIGNVAAAFGCKWHSDPYSDPWIEPLIGENNREDVYTLTMPDLKRNGLNGLALERIDYFQAHSNLPLRLVNVPSPLVTASLIWEYSDFLISAIEYPQAVHHLLSLVTEATISFIQIQLERNRQLFGLTHEPWYLPPDLGIRISDDTAAVMSPSLYREFALPYNGQIGQAFGGLVLHSCGDITHVIPGILATPGLIGIDLVAPQNDLKKIKDVVAQRVSLCLRYFTWDFQASQAPDLLEYSQELVELFGRNGILLWTQVGSLPEAQVLSHELHRLLSA